MRYPADAIDGKLFPENIQICSVVKISGIAKPQALPGDGRVKLMPFREFVIYFLVRVLNLSSVSLKYV